MSTNRWKIILDNFPRYFTERIDFLYGIDMVCRLSSHMKGSWDGRTFTDVDIKAVLGVKEKFEEKYATSVEVKPSTALKGKYNSECSVDFDTHTVLNMYNQLASVSKSELIAYPVLRVYLKPYILQRVDLNVESVLKSKGFISSEGYMPFEIRPFSSLKGSTEQRTLVDVTPLGKLSMKGKHSEESYFTTSTVGVVGTFYKVKEHNDKTISSINQTSLFDLCVKTIY